MAIKKISIFGLFLMAIAYLIAAYQLFLYLTNKSEEELKTVKDWEYIETTLLRSGSVAQKKPGVGEISIEEFKTISDNGALNKVILDVRDVDEAVSGVLKGAINIPVGQIRERLAELPKDREIITYCNTGFKAKMAYDDLKKNGFRTRFLNAAIYIKKDGKYEIKKNKAPH